MAVLIRSMNRDRIGVTTVRIGLKAVASEFCNLIRLPHKTDKQLLVPLEYCAKLSNPALIPLITPENARITIFISKPVFIIRDILNLALSTDFSVFFIFPAIFPPATPNLPSSFVVFFNPS